jgi:hypothetical protein
MAMSDRKNHRRLDGGGKKSRGLSPAEQEAQDALQLGRQAEAAPAQDDADWANFLQGLRIVQLTPAQDAPVIETAGEGTPAEKPGDRPPLFQIRTPAQDALAGHATDWLYVEVGAGVDPAAADPDFGDLEGVEVSPPAAAPATPAAPRRKTPDKLAALLNAALVALWAGLCWLGRQAKAAGIKVAPKAKAKAKAVGAAARRNIGGVIAVAAAVVAVLVAGGFLLRQGSLAYQLAMTWWPDGWVTGEAAFAIQAVSLVVGCLWAAVVGLVVGTALVLAWWLVVKLWNVVIATAMAFGFQPPEKGLLRKHAGPVQAMALLGRIWGKIYEILAKDSAKAITRAVTAAAVVVIVCAAFALLGWVAGEAIHFINN